MTITGGIKVFEKSDCLFKDGAEAVASSATDSANYMLSMNKYLRWDSIGSDDTTSEDITITFDSTTFSRLFLVSHNLKEFTITYGAGSTAFTNVVGIDGTKSGITETVFSENTSYYEFDAVTTTQINISALKTQVADDEKYITLVAVTTEMGTFEGYPQVTPMTDANEKRAQVQTGKYITQKSFETFNAKISQEHTSQEDIDLLNTMYERQQPFLLWLCGGKYGTANFSVEFKNWRLQDLYQVQTYGPVETRFRSNVYTSSPMTAIQLAEEV